MALKVVSTEPKRDPTLVTLEQQVACVSREIAMRRNVYPSWVTRGRMQQSQADEEIARMEAVMITLKRMQVMERHLRGFPQGHDEDGVYGNWKEEVDADLKTVGLLVHGT